MSQSSLPEDLQKVQALIEQAETAPAITALHAYLDASGLADLQRELTLLSARHKRLLNEERKGTINPGEVRAEQTRIDDALLALVDEAGAKSKPGADLSAAPKPSARVDEPERPPAHVAPPPPSRVSRSTAPPAALRPTYERSWALVIGIDNYASDRFPPLKTAVNGAKEIAGLLKDRLRFDEVKLLINAEVTRENVLGEMDRIANEAGPDDRFLFYYAGHGLTRKTKREAEVGYLSLHNSLPNQWRTLLQMDDVLEQAEFIPAKHILFVLDSCFSGLAFTRAASAEQRRLAKDFLLHPSIQAISAGRDGETVADGGGPEGKHSLFTWRFVEGLCGDFAGSFGVVRADEFAPWLQTQVRVQARARQTPQFGHLPGSGRGDFIFEGWQIGEQAIAETPSTEPERTRAAGDAFATVTVKPTPPPAIALVGAPLDFEPAWVPVPAGTFNLGSAPSDWMAFDDERPQHPVTIREPFYISKAPVTNRQYAAFVTATGRRPPKHWRDISPRAEGADLPVTWVNWHDAVAYCEWLTVKLREAGRLPGDRECVVRLPTEPEWEWAARGDDGRRFPWGDQEPDETHANFGSNEKTPTPVGAYSPKGDSPCGCVDMAGNVWEWTLSLEKPYPYEPHDGREELHVRGRRSLRGGAYDASARNIRAAIRNWNYPEERDGTIGFRVVLVSR